MADEGQAVVVEKKSKKLVWILIAAGALVVVGGGGFLLVKYLRPPQTSAAAGEGAEFREGGGALAGRVKSTFTLDPFLVNLADQESTRYIKVTLRLGLDQSGLGEGLAEDPVVVAAARDKIITILTTRTSEQVLSSEGKDKLRDEIRDSLNPLLPRGRIVEVYIMDFVVQL